jgi:hypothetical protein
MEQLITVKKVTVNEDRNVQFLAEFKAESPAARDNLFALISLQGEGVQARLTRPQLELFEENEA